MRWARSACELKRRRKSRYRNSTQNDLPVIRTQKGFSTLIEFPEDKKIVEVTCGDKEFWVVEGKGRFLHVKPAKEGIITNLNVLTEGDVVYAFLLKEISRTVDAKDGPDLRVTVNGVDEVAKLRKDKEDLEEALSRSEHALKVLRALKELNDKSGTEEEAAPKKEQPVPREHGELQRLQIILRPCRSSASLVSTAPAVLPTDEAPVKIALEASAAFPAAGYRLDLCH